MKKIFVVAFIICCMFGCDIAIEGENCHKDLTIFNDSTDTVIISTLATYYGKSECFLTKAAVLAPGASFTDHSSKTCFEALFASGLSYYVVDPDHFNEPTFYSCDSLLIKNRVLRHYKFSGADLEALKKSNFTISYP